MESEATQVEITVGLDDLETPEALRALVAKKLGRRVSEIPEVRLLKRALDARRGKVSFHLLVDYGPRETRALGEPHPREGKDPPTTLVIGDGPTGLFCAYELARRGIRSIVVDRGKPVQPRRRDLKLLNARGGVDADSNYCFGEGGAGTYSDGKLYTRSHKRGSVRDVLEILALHGAPEAILSEARPHIGSNLLPKVISAMRERLAEVGVEFRFGRRVTELLLEGEGASRRVVGAKAKNLETEEDEEILAEHVVLATGHSARDVFEMLARLDFPLEAKPFALGVRIEHPQALIDGIQYGKHCGHPKLGAASYKVVEQVDGRGVFSFCMCPGGWIVPAMTDAEHLVVNGMSLSKRDSGFANSGLVVGVELADYATLGLEGPLAGIEVQKRAERAARLAGGGENRAPATRASDFFAKRTSQTTPATSYLPGLTGTNLAEVLAATGLPIAERIRVALGVFERKMRGYASNEAVLVGVESRTSAPVRVVRDDLSLETPGTRGLYPAGEGAGYAGGIVSAAVDGIRIAEKIAAKIRA